MNKTEVIKMLEENQNEKGIKNWKRLYPGKGALKSYGIGLTVLRKLSKRIGRDHELAMALWKSDVYDARVIALLIDDPKVITRGQVEKQVENLEEGYLAHVFSSCDATLAKTPFVVDLSCDWIDSDDPIRRRCGYGLLYEIAKWTKKSSPDDDFFLERISQIRDTIDTESPATSLSMGVALTRIGMRNTQLHSAALKIAREIGRIETGVEHGEPYDPVKHLTSDYVTKKLGIE